MKKTWLLRDHQGWVSPEVSVRGHTKVWLWVSCLAYSPRQLSRAKGHIPMPLLLEASQIQPQPLSALPAPSLKCLRFGLRGNNRFHFPAGRARGQFTERTHAHSSRPTESKPLLVPIGSRRLLVNREESPRYHPHPGTESQIF